MTDLRIKGKGDTREVYDGGVLVGRIRKMSRAGWTGNVVLGKSATFRQVVDTWWEADWPDGTPVRYQGGPVVTHDYIKDAQRRSWWFGRGITPCEVSDGR